jgi:hypothetical protein
MEKKNEEFSKKIIETEGEENDDINIDFNE